MFRNLNNEETQQIQHTSKQNVTALDMTKRLNDIVSDAYAIDYYKERIVSVVIEVNRPDTSTLSGMFSGGQLTGSATVALLNKDRTESRLIRVSLYSDAMDTPIWVNL